MKVKHLIELFANEDPETEILTYNPAEGSQPTSFIKVGMQATRLIGWIKPCPKCNGDGSKCYKCYQSNRGAAVYGEKLFVYGE